MEFIMATSKSLNEQLKQWKVSDGSGGDRDAMRHRVVPGLMKLPSKLRSIGLAVFALNDKGEQAVSYWAVRDDKEVKAARKWLATWQPRVDRLSANERKRIFAVLGEQLADPLEAAWQYLKTAPYQVGYRHSAFRAPKNPELTLATRIHWLTNFAQATAEYQSEVLTLPWLAAWAKHAFDYQAEVVSPLLIAAMNSQGSVGDQVFDILFKTVTREHPVGILSDFVIQSLLGSDRVAGWEIIEKALLAAQRQEGLRQTIVQSADGAHPEAFPRLLRMIVDHDLIRFSSIARAVDVWLSLLWDSASTKILKENITGILDCCESASKHQQALTSQDAETVYRALWVSACRDAPATVPIAQRLLGDPSPEIRYVAVWLLVQLGIPMASQAKAVAIDDDHLQVAILAALDLDGISGDAQVLEELAELADQDASEAHLPKDGFERLEKLYQRLPEKPELLKPLVWPWTARKIQRSDLAPSLLAALGDRPPTRMLPYLKGLSSWHQQEIVERLGNQKKWDALTRDALLELAGHASPDVRKAAVDSLAKVTLKTEECSRLEGYLTRTAADLRTGVVSLLVKQDDAGALNSAERLMAQRNGSQRLAGLEILRQMAEADRSRSVCQELATTYRSTQKKISPTEEVQLKEISQVDRRAYKLDDALGLMDPAGRSPVIKPKKQKIPLITRAAIECIKSLDDLVHAHRAVPVRYKSWRQWEEQLLGEVGYGLPAIRLKKPLPPQLQRFPLWETWAKWRDERPSRLRDQDGLELLRALAAIEMMDDSYDSRSIQDFVKQADNKKIAVAVLGEMERPKLRYAETVHDLLRWLFFTEIPKGALDYLLDCVENTAAQVPEKMLQQMLEKPKKKKRFYWEDEEEDWRGEQVFKVWPEMLTVFCNVTGIKKSDAQQRREFELGRFWDEPIPGARRRRIPFTDLIRAYQSGYATRDDVIDALLGPDRGEYGRYDQLSAITHRNPSPIFREALQESEELSLMVDQIRSTLLEIELNRGEKATVSSEAILAVKSFCGIETLFRILAALNGKFKVLTRWNAEVSASRVATFTQLVRVTYPHESETGEDFTRLAKKAIVDGTFSEDALLELAFLAPQWTRFAGEMLSWDGFSEGLYWFLAHMDTWMSDATEAAADSAGLVDERADDDDDDDDDWDDDDQDLDQEDDSNATASSQRKLSAWERLILERTPLSVPQRRQGAVDVAWFHRTFAVLGEERWKRMAQCAKLAANSAQAKKAQFLADVLLGHTPRKDLIDGIKKRYLKEHVRLLGLLPLATGAKRDSDLLERYQVLQEYKKYARGLSSLAKPEAMRAYETGMGNLARLAGYPDPLRLQWALEAESIKDLARGPVSVTKDGVTVTLRLDEQAKPQLTVARGEKSLKSIPAPLKKKHAAFAELAERATELKKNTSRIKQSLEAAMCRGDAISGTELMQLMQHAILAPQLERLVLIGEGIAGYPDKDGKVLRDHQGKWEPVKKTEQLRIAHPADLMKQGDWDQWQHECFRAERVQPFKQVFRELYLPTKQEVKATFSQRFSGQQIGPRQAMALWSSRGWNTQDEVVKIFPDRSLIAGVSFQDDIGTAAEVEGLTVDKVLFCERDSYRPLKLGEVPPVLLSEVLRDVDLVVSVAHRGEVDPEASASTVEMRAALIRETCLLLGLTNVRFKPTHAVIQGYYGQYSLHLGSGGVHKLPGGALAILPVHAQHRGRLFLPFADDDPKTAEILSKVLLLARDEEIMDPMILDQLGAPQKKRPVTMQVTSVQTNEGIQKLQSPDSNVRRQAPGRSAGEAPTGASPPGTGKRRFEFSAGKSNKFWEIELAGNTVTTTWGRIGSNGQTKSKEFADTSKAQAEYDKLVKEKTSKGYLETS
jgi:predicted DNA-binding WGR domain protein